MQERVAPASAEAVGEIVGACDRAGEKVSIVGGNTLEGMSLPPERADVTLDIDGAARRRRHTSAPTSRSPYERERRCKTLRRCSRRKECSCRSTRRCRSTQRSAARWPPDGPARAGTSTDGRAIIVIGSTIVLADGTIARAGGMVVKNVAGYDMSRLYVGSFGTLGMLAQANFKTIPLPPHARCFLAPLPERTRGRAAVQLAGLSIRPSAAFIVRGFHNAIDGEDGDEGRIFALIEGSDALLERATLEICAPRSGAPACPKRA